jgi:hypothetical protein
MQTMLDLKTITCAECYNIFGVIDSIIKTRKQDGLAFYCPLGHANVYKDNENSRLKEERDELKRQAESIRKRLMWAEQRESSALAERDSIKKAHAATKGQLTKTRNRIAHGVCPCCNRTFANIARHMTSKHPEYKKAE